MTKWGDQWGDQWAAGEPIRLTVICPASGDRLAADGLNHPAGYVVANMLLPALGRTVTHDPVGDVAHALEHDGYSASVNFALIDPAGATLYLGPVNTEMQRRQQEEQRMRQAAGTAGARSAIDLKGAAG